MVSAYIVTGEGADRRRIPVGASLIVGRAADSGLVLKDTAASRRHAEIRATGDGYLCRDLGSRNGSCSRPAGSSTVCRKMVLP